MTPPTPFSPIEAESPPLGSTNAPGQTGPFSWGGDAGRPGGGFPPGSGPAGPFPLGSGAYQPGYNGLSPSAVKHLASPMTQVLLYALGTIALAALSFGMNAPEIAVLGAGALALGIAITLSVDLTRYLAKLPGVVMALCGVALLFFLWVIAQSRSRNGFGNPAWILLVGLVLLGLDWKWIERLRPVIALSGLCVIPAIGEKAIAALPFAVAWFAMALASYWSCERDLVQTSPHLAPISSSSEPPRPANTTADLIRTIGFAAGVGIIAALLIGNPSCSRNKDQSGSGGRNGTSGSGSQSGAGSQTGSGSQSGSGSKSGSGSGSEHSARGLVIDRNGVVRDQDGKVIDASGAAHTDGLGNIVDGGGAIIGPMDRYTRDSDGRLNDSDSNRPRVDPSLREDPRGNGDIVDSNGNIVGTTRGIANGRDPASGNATSQGNGSPGKVGGITVTTAITPTTTTPPPDKQTETDYAQIAKLLLLLLVLGGLVALAWPFVNRWLREDAERAKWTWAQSFAHRLEYEGRVRGRPRRRSETILDYVVALDDSVLTGGRLSEVATVISSALFGRSEIPADVAKWADDILDEATAANEPPTRWERVRGKDGGAKSSVSV